MTTLTARIQWLQGFPEQAAVSAREAVESALRIKHVLSLGYAICMGGCPVALWSGDLSEARRCIDLLTEYAAKNGLYSTWGKGFERVLGLRQGSDRDVLTANYIEARLDVSTISALAGLSAEKLGSGDFADPLPDDARWSYPEVMRIDAELLLMKPSAVSDQEAEAKLLQSLERAKSQSLLSFELRAAIALARLWNRTKRAAKAGSLLKSTYGKFTEGFATSDLLNAARLLAELG
jgi:hypothetical protein